MTTWVQPTQQQQWEYAQTTQQMYQTAGSEGSTGQGNNPYGSTGTIKCDECRRRRKACDYNPNFAHLPCVHCATDPQKAALCIKKPAPNTMQTQPPQPQLNTGASAMRAYLDQFEHSYPNASLDEILAYLITRPWGQQQQQPAVQQTMPAENAPNGWIWSGTHDGGYVGNGNYYPQ